MGDVNMGLMGENAHYMAWETSEPVNLNSHSRNQGARQSRAFPFNPSYTFNPFPTIHRSVSHAAPARQRAPQKLVPGKNELNQFNGKPHC